MVNGILDGKRSVIYITYALGLDACKSQTSRYLGSYLLVCSQLSVAADRRPRRRSTPLAHRLKMLVNIP